MSIVDNIIGQIAKKHLGLSRFILHQPTKVETLETRGLSVGAIKEALLEAYKAGKEDVLPVHLLTENVSEWNDYANRTCGFRANLSQKIYVSEWGNCLAELDRVTVELKFENREYFLEISLGGRYLAGDEEGRPAVAGTNRSEWLGGIYYRKISRKCWNEKTEIFRKQFLEKDPYVHDIINIVLNRALTADGSGSNERKFEGIGSSFNLDNNPEFFQSIYDLHHTPLEEM